VWDSQKLVDQVLDAANAQQVAIPDVTTWPSGGALALSASEFLADSFSARPERLAELLESGDLESAYPHAAHMRQRVIEALDGAADKADLGVRLRRIRRREMSRIAWRDLGGAADLDETLRDLSAFADAAISESLSRLDAFQQARRGVPTDAEGQPQALVVYALGKLGAGELNYSSDVDLIFAYPRDGETVGTKRTISNHEYFVELGRSLIETLQRRSDEGFVFRVDMRLRPFGRDGPLAMSFAAMEDYYQHHGRDWERYALIRMRPVAGDRDAGQRLYDRLTPFVFRRYLDFGTLESLREMKAMIAAEVARRELDDHVKLGPGGIRELEFTVQAFQLVRGGRQPALRSRRVNQVLDELGRRELLPVYAVERLKAAYVFLRRVENRLQEFNDKQTHTLPADDAQRSRLATVMGLDGWEELAGLLAEHRDHVRAQFDQVLGGDESDHQVDPAGTLLLESQDSETIDALMHEFGFSDEVAGASEFVLRLRDSGERRSMDNTGARRLSRLLPDLLRAVANTDTPLTTLERVLSVVTKILRRSTYLALLHERPITVSHFVQLCAASPWIAHQIGEQPQLLDELLDARTLYQPPGRDELDQDMTERLNAVDEGDLEAELAALRQFRHRQVLRVAAADIAEALPLMKVSDHLTDIAEVVLDRVMALAWRDIAARHGVPRNEDGEEVGFIIVAYGKLGGIELGYGSDLDIVFIHDDSTPATDGPRPVDSQVFFLRLAQRIVHYLTTTTPDGILYAVDTRLRPHGKDGMLACSLESFEDYQREKAWTWEHQALLRTRAVAGSESLARDFSAARERILLRDRDVTKLRDEVCDMRSRMRSQLDSKDSELFDLKQGRGGITDIEFMVQFAALRWADRLGSHLGFTDNIRLLEGLALAGVLTEEDARCLDEAYKAYRERMHRLSLQEQPGTVSASEFAALREQVSRVWRRLMEDREPTSGC
jgi:glutamate-ammonia-ligase adenylyltransferase